MINFLKNKASGAMDSMTMMTTVMGLISAFMAGNKQELLDKFSEFATDEKVKEAAAGITDWYKGKQLFYGPYAQLRAVLSPDAANEQLVLSIWLCDMQDPGKNTAIFNKALPEFTENDIKTLVDAILTAMFAKKS